jgi:hypothetical protein
LFADDTNIQIKATNEDILNQNINSYAAVINTEKTITMLFNTRQIKSFLKPKIIFEGMDFRYKFEKKNWVYI